MTTSRTHIAVGVFVVAAIVTAVFFAFRATVPVSVPYSEIAIEQGEQSTTSRWWDTYFSPPKVVQSPDLSLYPRRPEDKPKPFIITSDSALLRGESFFYMEREEGFMYSQSGVLYRTKLQNGVAVERGQKVAEGIQRILAQDEKTLLFIRSKIQEGGNPFGNELWLVDKEAGVARAILLNIDFASVSSDEEKIAISTGQGGGFGSSLNEIRILDRTGNEIGRVGGHGSSPIFSGDGTKIAYLKMDDNQMGDMGSYAFRGISVYDLATGKETVVSDNPEDYNPVGFSSDGSRLLFISGRGGRESLWSKKISATGSPALMSDTNVSVHIDSQGPWSSDGFSVVGASSQQQSESMLSLFTISPDFTSASVEVLGKGTSPRWKVQDKVIEFKGEQGWEEVDVSNIVARK